MVYGPRLIVKIYSVDTQTERVEVQFKDDTHIYTCFVGKYCYTEPYLDWYCIVKPFLDSYEGKSYRFSMNCIVVTIKMSNITLSVLIGHSILSMKRWHLYQFYRQEDQGQ